MSYTAQGRIHEIYEEQQVSEKFRKREFILEVADGAYTQFLKFQLSQDKCSLLDTYSKGDNVSVDFNLTGRLYTGKDGKENCFTSLNAWKLALDVSTPNPQHMKDNSPVLAGDVDNDLPF
jgi:hypothetical protein